MTGGACRSFSDIYSEVSQICISQSCAAFVSYTSYNTATSWRTCYIRFLLHVAASSTRSYYTRQRNTWIPIAESVVLGAVLCSFRCVLTLLLLAVGNVCCVPFRVLSGLVSTLAAAVLPPNLCYSLWVLLASVPPSTWHPHGWHPHGWHPHGIHMACTRCAAVERTTSVDSRWRFCFFLFAHLCRRAIGTSPEGPGRDERRNPEISLRIGPCDADAWEGWRGCQMHGSGRGFLRGGFRLDGGGRPFVLGWRGHQQGGGVWFRGFVG